MPFRLAEQGWPNRAKIQFTTSAAMPSLIFKACLATGMLSNTAYCQHALCQALARDLGLDLADLLADLPAARGPSAHLFDPAEHTMARHSVELDHSGGRLLPGPANCDEEVR